ncbi:MAG: hypothetical protein KGQ79_08815 [Proteobacteria bacterium]|nr:hypothetical protein [Pseudomonadota bacterium]
MSALALLPLLGFCAAAGLGFAASAAAHFSTRRRPAPPPPRGFRPVVIEGGKAQAQAEKAAQ